MNSGKKFSDADICAHADGFFARSVQCRNTVMGIDAGTSSQLMLTMKAGDLPGDTRSALRRDFARAGVPNSSDAQLLGAYWTLRSARR